MSTPQTASTLPPETQELLLFIIGQLFRVECEVSSIHSTVVSIRAAQVPAGFDTLVRDPLELRLSAGARRSACTVYEEALDTIQSPALREHVRGYVAEWCAGDDALWLGPALAAAEATAVRAVIARRVREHEESLTEKVLYHVR